jgi:predicted RNA-binding Zn-ribbon protein involved in translation (DUF1610 family)
MLENERKHPFQKQWEEYRRRRNRQYIVGAIGFVAPSLIFFALRKNGMESGKAMVLMYFLSMFALIVIVAVMLHFRKWICPNCGKRFFVRSFWNRFPELLHNCVNCNLQKYTGSTFVRK